MNPRLVHAILITASVLASAVPAWSACPPQAETERRAAAFLNRQTAPPYPGTLDTSEAYCTQRHYVAQLQPAFGETAGYKVAFTSRATQKRFGLAEPARGVLLAGMLHADGATLPADFAARPLIEPDLMVTVADDGIMAADTPLEAARHLGEIRAFLELPALPLHEDAQMTGRQLIAFNAGARAGVQGPGIDVRATPAFVQALARMRMTLRNNSGESLATGRGEAILGQPLQAVLWLTDHLRAHGESLEAGQLVSLGTLAAPRPVTPGRTYELTYQGLPGGSLTASATITAPDSGSTPGSPTVHDQSRDDRS